MQIISWKFQFDSGSGRHKKRDLSHVWPESMGVCDNLGIINIIEIKDA
jgi:hypothetical protein